MVILLLLAVVVVVACGVVVYVGVYVVGFGVGGDGVVGVVDMCGDGDIADNVCGIDVGDVDAGVCGVRIAGYVVVVVGCCWLPFMLSSVHVLSLWFVFGWFVVAVGCDICCCVVYIVTGVVGRWCRLVPWCW